MKNENHPQVSARVGALVAGISVIIMAFAIPFAQFFVLEKIMVQGNSAETIDSLKANTPLFRAGIFCFLLTFLLDVPAGWGLYIFYVL